MGASLCWLLLVLPGLVHTQWARSSYSSRNWTQGGWGPPLQISRRYHPQISSMKLKNSNNMCGMLGYTVAQRIHGGEIAVPGEFPWMALLQYERRNQLSFQCGGALISKRYVLTAAHCTDRKSLKGYKLVKVRLGEYDITKDLDCDMKGDGNTGNSCADPPINYGIEETVEHEDYVDRLKNDISLVRLDADAPYTNFIRPICLPSKNSTRDDVGMLLVVAGWGRIENGTKSNDLRKVTLPVVDNNKCFEKLKAKTLDTQMCAGGEQGKDSCNGDSGGPLIGADASSGESRYEVYGIVSSGPLKCGTIDLPGVYTRVSIFVDWVQSKMRP